MTNEEKLSRAFEDVIWMAIRYAHGRHTYAPGMVRDAVRLFQSVHPNWTPKKDITITFEPDASGVGLRSDWLDDIMPNDQAEPRTRP